MGTLNHRWIRLRANPRRYSDQTIVRMIAKEIRADAPR
jgi:hypothetical protein